jgi:hypothetical protein
MRSALILNDQGEKLVDTEYVARHGFRTGEVTGGCFCCKYHDLLETLDALRAHSPDIIFAEPVGSCTDISASIVRPLLEHDSMHYRVAPLTVLLDPARASALLRDDADPHLSFLFRAQMQEADLVCFSKSDLFPAAPAVPAGSVRQISAKTGQGISAWLDEVTSGQLSAGSRPLDIDYRQYAQAENALVWLNAEATLEFSQSVSPAMVLGPFLDHLSAALTSAGILIVHLKAILESGTGFLKAAICADGQTPAVEGVLDASPATHHELLLNLRAKGDVDQVRRIVETALNPRVSECIGLRITCFRPTPPQRPGQAIGSLQPARHSEAV